MNNVYVFVGSWIFSWSIVWIANILFRNTIFYKFRILSIFLHFVVASMTMILIFHLYDAHLLKIVESFDLNHDDVFSGNELTPDAQAALDDLSNDAGRHMFILFGIPLFLIADSIVYVVYRLRVWVPAKR